MRRVALLLAGLGAVGVAAGCEVLVGIKDKTDAPDASTGDDGGSSSGMDPDVPCAAKQPPNLFCDDFDSELEAGNGWLWDIPTGGATIALDTMQYVTGPRSALFTIPAAPASGQLGASIGSSLQTGYRLAFDLRLDFDETTFASIPQVAAAQVYRTDSKDLLTIAYVVGPGNQAYAQLYEGSAGSPTNVMLTTPPVQKWTRIVLVYDANEGLTVLEDGQPAGGSTQAAHGAPGDVSIILGEVYTNGDGPAVSLNIDDVVFRGQ